MERCCDVHWTLTQPYRGLHGRRTCIFQVSPTMRGGKLAVAALPLLSSAVILHFQVSSAPRGGNLEIAALPLHWSAVNLHFQVSSALRGGNLEISDLPLLSSAVNLHFPVFLPSERRKTGNFRYAAGTYVEDLSIRSYIIFSLLSWVGASFRKMKDGHVWITIGWNNIESLVNTQ